MADIEQPKYQVDDKVLVYNKTNHSISTEVIKSIMITKELSYQKTKYKLKDSTTAFESEIYTDIDAIFKHIHIHLEADWSDMKLHHKNKSYVDVKLPNIKNYM